MKKIGIEDVGNVGQPVRRTEGTGAHEEDGIAGFAVHLGNFTLGESCWWTDSDVMGGTESR